MVIHTNTNTNSVGTSMRFTEFQKEKKKQVFRVCNQVFTWKSGGEDAVQCRLHHRREHKQGGEMNYYDMGGRWIQIIVHDRYFLIRSNLIDPSTEQRDFVPY